MFTKEYLKRKSYSLKNEFLKMKNFSNIITKKSYKKGVVLIKNTEHWLNMITNHLNHNAAQKNIDSNISINITKKLGKVFEKYKDNLNRIRKKIF